ncbi:MAG: hypothetical protein Kow0068_21780 [Marinilabiliales bacterium]
MTEELINFDITKDRNSIIKVLGVGGGGGNAVNYMFKQGIKDVNFVVCNTDAQALEKSPVPIKIQLGASLTEGLGAGCKPEQGKQAAIENLDDVSKVLADGTKMVFITAGMGGGTGTGAAPVIAEAAKKMGILTVAIVTMPFKFEGKTKYNYALEGISELKNHVDSLLIINNERLREIYGDLPISEAWAKADSILTVAAKGIAEIITVPGHINVDFADVETVMKDSGVAIMGQGKAEGERRAYEAIETALSSPLLNNNDIKGAKNILLNITSGTKEITMDEIAQISEYAQEAAGNNADIILGSCMDENLGEAISVTVIATGFSTNAIPELKKNEDNKKVVFLEDKPQDRQQTISFNLEDDIDITPKSDDEIENLAKTRTKVLKDIDILDPDTVDKLENEPAYKRLNRSVDLDKNYSADTDVSNYSINNENDRVYIKKNNSYLHDNVD